MIRSRFFHCSRVFSAPCTLRFAPFCGTCTQMRKFIRIHTFAGMIHVIPVVNGRISALGDAEKEQASCATDLIAQFSLDF